MVRRSNTDLPLILVSTDFGHKAYPNYALWPANPRTAPSHRHLRAAPWCCGWKAPLLIPELIIQNPLIPHFPKLLFHSKSLFPDKPKFADPPHNQICIWSWAGALWWFAAPGARGCLRNRCSRTGAKAQENSVNTASFSPISCPIHFCTYSNGAVISAHPQRFRLKYHECRSLVQPWRWARLLLLTQY